MTHFPKRQRVRFTMRPAAASIRCRDAADLLWEYIDGALDAERAAVIRGHLHACTSCRERHDGARTLLLRIGRAHVRERAPDTLRERIDALLRERGTQS
jgi:mycothiol system anti-sigma-R factor